MEKLVEILESLHFEPRESFEKMYFKKYNNNTQILVDLKQEKIIYDKKINLGDFTTSNIKKRENLVVLECVNRLLEIGYSANSIYLEKRWKSGRGTSGKADIVIYKNKVPHTIIECKKDVNEFNKEKNKMLSNGGQLFTYYNFERSVKFLILYTYSFETSTFQNKIIEVKNEWKALNNQLEIFSHWNKNFIEKGLLEENALPYNIDKKPLKENDLISLNSDDSAKIFNQFAEILRHNVISDKPNAFNKLLNLFVCKIIDENKSSNSELDFQVLPTDTKYDLQNRLNDLYKAGMKEFLNLEIADTSYEEIEKLNASELDIDIVKKVKDIILDLRLKKNPEFSFIEVYDDKTFDENSVIIKEIVELLQPYRFRYNHKQQFLGNFFELLLNTSMKQEAGQFFTPIPIAKFIVNSIPVEEIIKNKISKDELHFLPYVIDYAAGSGHFLTEYMDKLQSIIQKLDIDGLKLNKTISKDLQIYNINPYSWANEYVYGIEKDYRLVKTAKISSFLNGDGDANIIRADGLDNFYNSIDYIGKLKNSKKDKKDNENFDVVIANPPYSISSFKNNVPNIYDSFEFSEYIYDSSSEIEVLFIERIKQLLVDGGVAGVILPNSILNNNGLEEKIREYLIENFDIISIVNFGSKTFMATGVNTIALFLKKKYNRSNEYEKIIDLIYKNKEDLAFNGLSNPLEAYINFNYGNISFQDYFSLFNIPNEVIKNSDLYTEYYIENQLSLDEIINIEKKKLKIFTYINNKKIFYTDTLDKDDELELLGYKFSNRRGNEGIHPITKGKSIDECTLLYSNSTYKGLSHYIQSMFLGNILEIDDKLKKYSSYRKLEDMIDFKSHYFDLKIITKKRIDYTEIWGTDDLIYIREVAKIEKGKSITKNDINIGKIPVIAGGKNIAYYHNQYNREGNIITCSASGANAGFLNYFEEKIFASDCNTIKSKNEKKISTYKIFEILKEIQDHIYLLQRGSAQPHVYSKDIEKIKIPRDFLKRK